MDIAHQRLDDNASRQIPWALLGALEVAFRLLADGRPVEEIPVALQQILDVLDTASPGGCPAVEQRLMDPAADDLGDFLQRCDVRSGRDLRALFTQFGAAMAALALAYARQSQNGVARTEDVLSPALLTACLTDIESGLWADLVT